MANQLTLTVGTNTATIPLAGTNAKINAVIQRFLANQGIVTEGMTATQTGEAFLLEVKRIVLEFSEAQQRFELEAANRAAINATLASDNAM